MKRDIVIAMLIGFVGGVIVAVGIINGPALFKRNSTNLSLDKTNPVPVTVGAQNSVNFSIDSPPDNSIQAEKSTTVKGKAEAKTTMVVDTDSDSFISDVSGDGTFGQTVALSEGANRIQVTNYNAKGDSETKTITVFYTPEKL